MLELIKQQELLNEGGTIVCEHAKEDVINFDGFELYDQKRYGTVILTYFTNK